MHTNKKRNKVSLKKEKTISPREREVGLLFFPPQYIHTYGGHIV